MFARLLSRPVLLVVLSTLAGMVGMALAWVLLAVTTTLYQDHVRLTQLWELAVRQAQAAQGQAQPAPPATK